MTELTGRHVAAGFVGAFSIIIGVNVLLAVSAVRTFPGLEVKNSYVASQSFDADRAAQDALGWDVSAKIDGEWLVLRVDSDAGPVFPRITRATFGRATHVGADRELVFHIENNALVAKVEDLSRGNWNLRLAAFADDGTEFRRRIVLRVAP